MQGSLAPMDQAVASSWVALPNIALRRLELFRANAVILHMWGMHLPVACMEIDYEKATQGRRQTSGRHPHQRVGIRHAQQANYPSYQSQAMGAPLWM